MKPIDRRIPESVVRRWIAPGLLVAAPLLASSTSWALPDLVVSGVDASGVTSDCRDASMSGSMVVTVRNAGPDAVTVATRLLGFRDIDLDGAFSPTVDVTLGDVATPPLGPGESVDATVPLSGTLDFAGAPVSFFADRTNLVREVSEGNNVTTSGAFSEVPPTSTTFTLDLKYGIDGPPWGASSAYVAQLTDDDGNTVVDARDDVDILWMPWLDQLYGQSAGVHLRLADGRTGTEIAESSDSNRITSDGAPAIGDLDGDGVPEIVGVALDRQHLLAFNNDLTLKWTSDTHSIPGRNDDAGGVIIADLDAQGGPEIVVGAIVFSSTGRFLADGAAAPLSGYSGFGCDSPAIGPRGAVADIDHDGIPEVVAGASAYRFRGGRLSLAWKRTDIGEGYTAVANVDGDAAGTAEIVLVQQGPSSTGRVRVLDNDGTDAEFWNPPSGGWVNLPGDYGGPPTLADFDGDGLLDIAVTSSSHLTVLEYDGALKWDVSYSDAWAHTTPAAFDFDADGSAEIVARGTVQLAIYDGATGTVLGSRLVANGTGAEHPTIADIDADGHADVITLGTLSDGPTGLLVFENPTWAAARACWNGHDYHVSNIDDSGTRIARRESPRWRTDPPGDYHRQVWPGPVPFPAPDLTASLVMVALCKRTTSAFWV